MLASINAAFWMQPASFQLDAHERIYYVGYQTTTPDHQSKSDNTNQRALTALTYELTTPVQAAKLIFQLNSEPFIAV